MHRFARNAGVWAETTHIASPSSGANLFGYALAMSSDTVVIGAPFDAAAGRNAGAVYSLARDGHWGPLTKLTPRGSAAVQVFGWSVYVRNAGSWEQQAELSAPMPETGGTFGWSVALQGDLAAVGAPYASLVQRTPRGQTFLFGQRRGVRLPLTSLPKLQRSPRR